MALYQISKIGDIAWTYQKASFYRLKLYCTIQKWQGKHFSAIDFM